MTDKVKTTNQVSKKVTPPQKRNPSGKGGFGDNPQHRSSGYWKPEDSISFQYKKFMKMTPTELKEYAKIPDTDRTVAQDLAYRRVLAAQKSLPDMKEITDRVDGRAQAYVDLTSGGKAMPTPIISLTATPQQKELDA